MSQVLKVEYDMEEFFLGIKEAVKSELRDEISEEIKSEIKSEIKQKFITKVQEDIDLNTYATVKNMMEDIYNNETISIGGGWKEEAKEFTLKEYVINQVKEAILNNNCDSKKSYSKTSFQDWFKDKCVSPEIQKIIDKEITTIRNDINYKIKEMFDTSTRQMLSDTVLNVLMANETYQKIENNVKCIANK